MARDVRRQALDLNLAKHLIQDAAVVLHAGRNSQQLHANAYLEQLVERNALHVDVDQLFLDRLALRVHDHRLGRRNALNLHIENRVVAGLGVEDPRNLLGIDFDRNGILTRPIQYGRNLSRNAHAARGILVELARSGLGYDDFRHSILSFLLFGHGEDSFQPSAISLQPGIAALN